MKVTVILSNEEIRKSKEFSGGKTARESFRIILTTYLKQERLRKAMRRLKDNPLKFSEGFTADQIRSFNRG